MTRSSFSGVMVVAAMLTSTPIFAQASDPYLGQVMAVGFTFCPRGWTEADGQIMSIQQNSALFSLYGTTYGGNGTTTFALPDLRGRVAIHTGTGPGLPPVIQGQVMGTPTTTLTIGNLPAHTHSMNASAAANSSSDPSGNLLSTFASGQHIYAPNPAGKVMSSQSIGTTGSNIPFDQYQPSLVLRYCVALQGVFPSRN
jgi:microcystin-dependent protein